MSESPKYQKVNINYSIDLTNIAPYYNYTPSFPDPKKENNMIMEIDIERYVGGDDWNISSFIQRYFQPINPRNYTGEEVQVIHTLYYEIIAITYLFATYEWSTYFKYLYASYQIDKKAPNSKFENKGNFISKELEQLKEIINLLQMIKHLDRSDATFRLKSENGDVIKQNTLKIDSEEREVILNLLLAHRVSKWSLEQLTEEDIKYFNESLNMTFSFAEDLPIAQVMKKMNNITSQAIMKIFQDDGLYPNIELSYMERLFTEATQNWGWDERVSPLNKFNSLIAKTLDRYLTDKSTELSNYFKIGLKKQKEHIIFSCLRFFGFVPQNPKLDFDQPFDLKEDYIKDLLKSK
ncbi:hypothetical protein [Sphingobacterium sp. MYb388]|uniref:hypothetical protein n=1 Tax=Sphingobacterium sp. MYb388 TaxID=2745437 RepID=UPI0030A0CDB4